MLCVPCVKLIKGKRNIETVGNGEIRKNGSIDRRKILGSSRVMYLTDWFKCLLLYNIIIFMQKVEILYIYI